ncbi:MAG: M14 family zinc carboxypeptidase [Opitutales bacterium]
MTLETPSHGLLSQAPLPPGTFECAAVLESDSGRPTFGPDTPGSIPGNAQYVFLLRVPPGAGRSLDIVWPHGETPARPGFDYPHNANFSEVLDQVIFWRSDGGDWERLLSTRPRPHGVEVTLPASQQEAWLSVGIPYFAREFEDLMAAVQADASWRVEPIGSSLEGRTLHGCVRAARTTAASRGLFLLSAYQHYGEWAGLHAIDRLLRDAPPEADAFTWAVVPCVNMDGLYRGWRGDLQHRGDALDQPHGGNLNRAWNPPSLPETRAVADFFKRAAGQVQPLHALDLHMGWSSPDHGGDGLTVYHEGEIPDDLEARMRAFTGAFFKRVPIEAFAWEHSRLQGAGATPWFTRELDCPGQTMEISRFRATRPADQSHEAVSPGYYRALGRQLAEALVSFYS